MSGVEDLEDEVWKDVVSFEGLYEVSNTGRVRKTLSKQHLNVYKVKDGFYGASLRKLNSQRPHRIHILVAKAFIPNPNNYHYVRHIDGNKSNNNVYNLEWVYKTRSKGNLKYNIDDYIGKKFGKWTILEYVGNKNGDRYVRCRCECGKEQEINFLRVISGGSKACLSCREKTHGNSDSPLYTVWLDMKRRCYNPKNTHYADYGGRGISICNEWMDFGCFYDWAISTGYDESKAKTRQCTLDRIDTNGNYEPNNCKWSNQCEQNANKRISNKNTSGYIGISWNKNRKLWECHVMFYRKRKYLGSSKIQKDLLEIRNKYIIENNLPHTLQEYRGELIIINDEQKKVQEEWEEQNKNDF